VVGKLRLIVPRHLFALTSVRLDICSPWHSGVRRSFGGPCVTLRMPSVGASLCCNTVQTRPVFQLNRLWTLDTLLLTRAPASPASSPLWSSPLPSPPLFPLGGNPSARHRVTRALSPSPPSVPFGKFIVTITCEPIPGKPLWCSSLCGRSWCAAPACL